MVFGNFVRLHRAGDGAPFSGLKQAGTEVDPAVKEADEALAAGKVTALAKEISDVVARSIVERFDKVQTALKLAINPSSRVGNMSKPMSITSTSLRTLPT